MARSVEFQFSLLTVHLLSQLQESSREDPINLSNNRSRYKEAADLVNGLRIADQPAPIVSMNKQLHLQNSDLKYIYVNNEKFKKASNLQLNCSL